MQVKGVTLIVTATLWVMACGPAATPESRESASEPTVRAAEIVPGVQSLNASPSDRGSSQAGTVRSQSPTLVPATEPMVAPSPVAFSPTPSHDSVAQPPPTPASASAPTAELDEPVAESPHIEMYEAVNVIRAALSKFPVEYHPGLEVAAQAYADGGAWNTGMSVEPFLFEQGVRCKDFAALSTGYPMPGPPAVERDRFIPVMAEYLTDFESWAQDHEDYANHLWWWIQWESWDTLFLGSNWTHFGYGAAVNPKMSSPKFGNHPGVMIVCEK